MIYLLVHNGSATIILKVTIESGIMNIVPSLRGFREIVLWAETDYYIVPEVYFYIGKKSIGVYGASVNAMAQPVQLPSDFWSHSLPERRMIFFEQILLNCMPQEIIGPELLCGARFNTQLRKCLNKTEQKDFDKTNLQIRNKVFTYHNNGFGNVGATGGHLIPDYEFIVKHGFKAIYDQIQQALEKLNDKERQGPKGNELRAMLIAAEIPRKLAAKYAERCRRLIGETEDPDRQTELEQMATNCDRVPWEPAETFWQAVQSTWLIHMLVMAEESYPGPGILLGESISIGGICITKMYLRTKRLPKILRRIFWDHSGFIPIPPMMHRFALEANKDHLGFRSIDYISRYWTKWRRCDE